MRRTAPQSKLDLPGLFSASPIAGDDPRDQPTTRHGISLVASGNPMSRPIPAPKLKNPNQPSV